MTLAQILGEKPDRTVVEGDETVADLCMRTLLDMVEQGTSTQEIMVMYKGNLFYFDLTCIGIKPPYTAIQPEDTEEDTWMGQRKN